MLHLTERKHSIIDAVIPLQDRGYGKLILEHFLWPAYLARSLIGRQ